jgi:hypothetical protein
MKTELSKLEAHHEQLDIPVVIPSVIRKGFVQAMNGNELWVNTQTDEMVKFIVKDRETQRKLYCKHVKITIEVIDETELTERNYGK